MNYDVFMPYLRGTHWYSCTERRPRGHTVQISVRNNLECHNYVPGMYNYQFSKRKHLVTPLPPSRNLVNVGVEP